MRALILELYLNERLARDRPTVRELTLDEIKRFLDRSLVVRAHFKENITLVDLGGDTYGLSETLLHTRRETVGTSTRCKSVLPQNVVRELVETEEETRLAERAFKVLDRDLTRALKSV
jgi:hypothetical protein